MRVSRVSRVSVRAPAGAGRMMKPWRYAAAVDRKSTRLNSSHGYISYAVFCLKKKTHNAKSIHGELTPTHHTSLRRAAVQPDINAEPNNRYPAASGQSYYSRRFG